MMKIDFKTLLVSSFLALAMAVPAHAADFSKDTMKKMSVFLSNFTELGFFDIDSKTFLDEKHPGDMLRFAIMHNYINNYKSRIKECKVADCPHGSLTIEHQYVKDSLKRYFDYLMLKGMSVTDSDPAFYYDGKVYHFEGADGEAIYYARVDKAREEIKGVIEMSGVIYNADFEDEIIGTFEAVATPHEHNGKKTWALHSLTTTLIEN